MRLEATLLDGAGNKLEGPEVHWTSSDTVRVKVAPTGVVTASGVGWSLVSAASEGRADTVKVIVTD